MAVKEQGLRLRKLRISKGYTQDTLSERLGITLSAYKKIESGENGFSSKILTKLAYLDFSIDYILTGKTKSPDEIISLIDRLNEEEKRELLIKWVLEERVVRN